MKKFQIWVEGYRATGEHGNARFLSEMMATSFQEACDNFFKDKKDENKWGKYNSKKMSVWGLQLFDNEEDARKSNG
jgi:hypothetical protein